MKSAMSAPVAPTRPTPADLLACLLVAPLVLPSPAHADDAASWSLSLGLGTLAAPLYLGDDE